MPQPAHVDSVRDIFASARTIAVLGAHSDPERPAHYVPAYLEGLGYRVLPVNVTKVGTNLFGHDTVGALTDLSEPVDVVDVFRPSSAVPGHLEEILAMQPHPKVVWLQQGIQHDETANALRAAGIRVVQDRCMLADGRSLGLLPVG